MSDLLKKGFYTGLGAGLLLKDEILSALNPPVKVDDKPLEEMREQLRTVLARLAGNVGQGVDALKDASEEELAALLERFGLARTEDVEALQKRIADLEAQLKAGKKK